MVTDGALADVVAENAIEEVDAKAQEAVAMTLHSHTAHPFSLWLLNGIKSYV